MNINEVRTYTATGMEDVEILLMGDAHEGIVASIPESKRELLTVDCTEFDWDELEWSVLAVRTPVDFLLLCAILKDIEQLYNEWLQEKAWNN